MKYFIKIYGCQMNKSDAERVASLLQSIGYKATKTIDQADLIILVTCSVRQSAEDRVYGLMRQIKKLKAHNPQLKIVLTGCMALRKESIKRLKDIDVFLNIKDLPGLPKLLNKKSEQDKIETYFSIKPQYESSFTAYVPIMTGCNNYCSYCVVPYVRGREESRSPQEIISEVKGLIKNGYKEIFLLGQNVNSYSPKLKIQSSESIKDFPDLLEQIAKLTGKFWIRFLTSHPKDLSDKLIKVITKYDKITEYINLPIQSGDDQILKKMNRGYTVAHYKNLIKKIRQQIPNAAISTDIIVGFPGETKEQFKNTCKLFEEIKFDMAYINQYSPRQETVAARLKDNVSKAEKKRRDKVLTVILSKTALANNQKLVGETLEVLVDAKKSEYWLGKTRTFKVVKFKSNKDLLGKFVKIKIARAESFGLWGNLV
ncbi:MAG: tRNA (N6-isopentenyl adenosine(37)-C2)-methylthiotransferase MiaB [Candidatus Buchananbacteria bacterium]|nr:tRNA (N6-isopentenyl adenosine(37)-C2)-methylthiotransferase MiaB [Candidatus Buchananbacteria bacterium]